MKITLLAFMVGCLTLTANGQKVKYGLSLGVGSHQTWWRYNRGVGQGWDRTDAVPIIITSASGFVRYQGIELSLVGNLEHMDEKWIERYEDSTDKRVRHRIGTPFLSFQSISMMLQYWAVRSKKYEGGIGAGLGLVDINSVYVGVSTFDQKWLWRTLVSNQFHINQHWALYINLEYEKRIITVLPQRFEGEGHEIFSFGFKTGMRYTF